MIIERQNHIKFLKDEYRAEAEVFKNKFLSKAQSLLKDSQEIYIGKYLTVRDGEMIMKFPNIRNLPRKGEHLYCMLLPNKLQNYHNWGDMTYKDLYDERYKATEVVCIWHSPTDDSRFSLVGFRKIDIDFFNTLQGLKDNILVFAPQQPPLDYISNLMEVVNDFEDPYIKCVLDVDFHTCENDPILIKQESVTNFVQSQLSQSDTMILLGPPGTGKTYMIAELCAKLCSEGKSVLVTALTNRALMEIADKPFLTDMLNEGRVMKTNMTIDESRELNKLQSIKQLAPMPSCLLLSTFYISSGYAAECGSGQYFDVVIMDEASQALLAMFAVSKKLGRKNLWVGDIKQLSPVVALNEDIISSLRYQPMINGLSQMTALSINPLYQLTTSFRFGNRATSYTNSFYNGSLVSKNNVRFRDIPISLNKILSIDGGPSLILTDLEAGDYTPKFVFEIVTYLIASIIQKTPSKKIAVLACLIKTIKGLQRDIIQCVGVKSNMIIETIAKVQGLTTDIAIIVIPNVSYIHTLNSSLFNVATSRAREHTIIIADKNIINYSSINANVKTYLNKLIKEQMVYLPASQSVAFLSE